MPPSGMRLKRLFTMSCVRCSTLSLTLADAAAELPSTSKKALVTAIEILLPSKPVTLPLRRMTL